MIDYLCNAFTPDRASIWHAATAGLALKIRAGEFVEPEAMVERMDELGFSTLLLPTGDLDDGDFTPVASRGVRDMRSHLAEPWVAGAYLHTHSFDRAFDHADLFPFYAVCTDADVPVVMQAGTSGGLMPSECGRPIGIDRAALYFTDTRFVLSHTGYPWVDEAIAMARKFSNVFVGTASYPPRRWPAALVEFLTSHKVLFGTNFPTVGHSQAVAQLQELGFDHDNALVEDTARRVFTRVRNA